MFSNKTVKKQTAHIARWVRLIIAFLLAGFAILFIPLAYEYEIFWFLGLSGLSYSLMYYSMGFRSWIKVDREAEYTLCIRDNHTRTNAYVPIEYITNVELCEYSGTKITAPIEYEDHDFHHIYNQFGYKGKGLIVRYQLPKHISGDTERRSWQFPAPKAGEFLTFLKENAT